MHKIFISYHHRNDQTYKEYLVGMGKQHGLFIDGSVDTGDIPEDWETQTIRREIRDNYLRDSSVTILLCGEETRHRKHIDWELKSSMIDGEVNKKSGILVIMLPTICRGMVHASHDNEREAVHSDITNWISLDSRLAYEQNFPALPDRIIDNLIKPEAKISVCPWNRIECFPARLEWLIDAAYKSRKINEYDLERPMRKHDRNPAA